MKVVDKKELKYANGYVVHGKKNEVINDPQLVHQYNELMEMKDFNEFLEKNEDRIKAGGEQVFYEVPVKEQAIQIEKPATPLADQREKDALAFWNEHAEAETVSQANALLARYQRLTTFIKDEQVLVTGVSTGEKFTGNILELTKKQVKSIVKDYVAKGDLRAKVIVK